MLTDKPVAHVSQYIYIKKTYSTSATRIAVTVMYTSQYVWTSEATNITLIALQSLLRVQWQPTVSASRTDILEAATTGQV